MPELIRVYIRNVFFGAGLSAAFVALLMYFNVANLRHLILAFRHRLYRGGAVLRVQHRRLRRGAVRDHHHAHGRGRDAPGGGKRDGIPAGLDPAVNMVAVPVPAETRTQRRKTNLPL